MQGAKPFYHPLVILPGTEPVSALTTALIYCCALRLYNLSFLDFVSGDLALTGF